MVGFVTGQHRLGDSRDGSEAEPPRRTAGEEILGTAQGADQRLHHDQHADPVRLPRAATAATERAWEKSFRRAPPAYPRNLPEDALGPRSDPRDDLLTRRVEPTVLPRVHYRLTPLGLSLESVLLTVRTWAAA